MMPEAVEDCVESVLDDNPDYSKDRAYAICHAQQNRGELSVGDDASHADLLEAAAVEGPCPDGQVNIGDECVPFESVDAPPSILSAPRVMASASPLDTQPIEREELGGDKVAYRGIKLIDTGVWTDKKSTTPTLYDERTFENTTTDYPEKYDGPPVNISHDIHKAGPKKGEPHKASVGGHIDPDSIDTDGDALFGDLILDRSTDAGAFADTNLKSALENNGTAGFSPSVELMPTDFGEAAHPHAEEYVTAAKLEGLGLVRDPASKSVDFAHETRSRSVAMAASSKDAKVLTRKDGGMSPEPDTDAIRAAILSRELQVEEIQDDAEAIADELDVPVGEVLEVLDPLLDMDDDGDGGDGGDDDDGVDAGDDPDDPDDDDDDDDDRDMVDDAAIDVLNEQIDDLWDAIDELKNQMATSEEMSEELADAKDELAAADTVAELEEAKEELDRRLSEVEDQPKEGRTLADDSETPDFEPSYDGSVANQSSW